MEAMDGAREQLRGEVTDLAAELMGLDDRLGRLDEHATRIGDASAVGPLQRAREHVQLALDHIERWMRSPD